MIKLSIDCIRETLLVFSPDFFYLPVSFNGQLITN
jgi:hypothetical protein